MRKFPWLEDLDSIIYCPTCRKRIDNIWQDNNDDYDNMDTLEPEFCPFCGQHLDWLSTVSYGLIETHD